MDTFVDSSWYFLRYTDANNLEQWYNADVADYWMNVDFYCGGIEHAQMHLIYARFYTKALRDLGFHSIDEPFNELLCQGMVNKSAPFCETCSVTLSVDHAGSPCPHCDSPLGERSAKMSKSLGNTVSPEQMIEQFGADTVRLFILFAANPTAGMDWSDSAVEANHRVMQQLQTMPDQLLGWDKPAHSIDAWMMARLRQRLQQWSDAMDKYDLRRAVECSHYDMVKDINWYVRRGGGNAEVGRTLLHSWTHMIGIATPHLAEDWWAQLGGDGLLAAHVMDDIQIVSEEDQALLDGEALIRDLLEQARKVRSVAERHIDGDATSLTIVTSAAWRNTMAEMALTHLSEGNNVKTFMGILTQSELAQGETRGERLGFWNKRMLPQVFKWDDEKKRILLSTLDETQVYANASDFIAEELGLASVGIVRGESEEDETGKAGVAMPLSPAFIYA
jgi:leucyl-tRNA synthetase